MRVDDLAGDAEAEIGLVPRPHHADEFAARILGWKATRCDLHRALGGRVAEVGALVASGEQREDGDERRSGGNLDEARDPGMHGGAPSLDL